MKKLAMYAHQKEALALSWDRPYYALFMEQGTGKSKVVIETIKSLWASQQINAALVISPKGVYLNWINDEFPKHLDLPKMQYEMLHWSSSLGTKAYKHLIETTGNTGANVLKLVCMNIEALSHKSGCLFAERFLKNHRSLMVIDESTSIKTYNSKRTKSAKILGKMAHFRRILSGTPQTKSPLDLWSQCDFLMPGVLGFTSFYAYRAHYAEIIPMTFGARSFPKIVGYRDLDRLAKTLSHFSYRKLKEECLDLPPKIYMRRYVETTPEQNAAYKDMEKKNIAEIGGQGELVTAPLAITKIMRLHQILCGHVKMDDIAQPRLLPSNRVSVMMDVIEETEGKAIIWCNFKQDVKIVTEALLEAYGKDSYVEYHGDVGTDDREAAKVTFQNNPTCRFFVGTLATGSRGLTLVAASTIIYYSQNHNLELRLQSEDRAHRIGQTQSLTIVDLMVPGTIDEDIIESHKNKQDLATQVIDKWRKQNEAKPALV